MSQIDQYSANDGLNKAVIDLLQDYCTADISFPRIEIYTQSGWIPIPFDWNIAKRLAELTGGDIRMVGENGWVHKIYDGETKICVTQ